MVSSRPRSAPADDTDFGEKIVLAEEWPKISPPVRGCIWLLFILCVLAVVFVAGLVAKFSVWAFLP